MEVLSDLEQKTKKILLNKLQKSKIFQVKHWFTTRKAGAEDSKHM